MNYLRRNIPSQSSDPDSRTQSMGRQDLKPDGVSARKQGRAPMRGYVMIHDENRLYIAPLTNISAGGVFVSQLVNIPTGRNVRVVVKSNKLGAPIQALGTIVRIETEGRTGSAVEFTSLSTQDKEHIQACVFETRLELALKAA